PRPTPCRCLRRRARAVRRPHFPPPLHRATAGGTDGGARSSFDVRLEHTHLVIVSPTSDSSVRPMQVPGSEPKTVPPSHAESRGPAGPVILALRPPERVCALGRCAGTYSPV